MGHKLPLFKHFWPFGYQGCEGQIDFLVPMACRISSSGYRSGYLEYSTHFSLN
ncbi:uncharacterized protein G2W53_041252 [Senna tora]|uniref:Uncharacterized protein n=1 Tax=Senna tora TaxID=362788 RepID=A0A834SET2_9FABA|nr:uncharacterized protein G2W53_041252 [Senna tora]